MVHAFVTPTPFLPQVCHVVFKDIPTNADIVLVAHYHKNWEKQNNNTIFKDIGCLGRNSITEADIKPSYLVIDSEKRSIDQRYITGLKPKEEIFDLDKIQELKEFDSSINKFIQSLESVNFQAMSIEGTIEHIAKENEVDRDIVDILINSIKDLKDE